MVILITVLQYTMVMAAEVSILHWQSFCSSCYFYLVAGGTIQIATRKAEGFAQRRVA
jgi:hypothetical protein